ncbi:hypothetical protein Pla52n_62060 [Stieleria varia]|uniref:Uncharacterized protein n=1 Tax=Stieleria varia TaxID=2528005 RepID=A0A5C5ZXF8_9BACT|nr:hypothetical protein Pla52n_62060 [Stieleria varia]
MSTTFSPSTPKTSVLAATCASLNPVEWVPMVRRTNDSEPLFSSQKTLSYDTGLFVPVTMSRSPSPSKSATSNVETPDTVARIGCVTKVSLPSFSYQAIRLST